MLKPKVSIIISTFGDISIWGPLSQIASLSAVNQTSRNLCEVIIHHEDNLAKARNLGAEKAIGDWLIFLDADDELDSKYVESMLKAVREKIDPTYVNPCGGITSGCSSDWCDCGGVLVRLPQDMWQPATLGVVGGVEDSNPVVIQPRGFNFLQGNHLVIGTMVPRIDFLEVGGFRDLEAYEDWDLFIRLWLRGLKSHVVSDAVYRVTVCPGSRNDILHTKAIKLCQEIRGRYETEARKKGLI